MKLRHAMVCAFNQNRNMEAHALLKKHGFDVSSYGTGAHMKSPGTSIREPNVYEFGTPYRRMFDDLKHKDPELYKRNGLFQMLKRNLSVKMAPQRWHENAVDGPFDVVFTFEEKVFDMVIEDLQNREPILLRNVLVFNLNVKDSHKEAAGGARLALDLCQKLEASNFWELIQKTKQLLFYEDKKDYGKAHHSSGNIILEQSIVTDRSTVQLYNDRQDCFIDICSPEVLLFFTDNFDYQQLRRDFVKALLGDEVMGYKIFTYEIHSDYAARIDNFRGYDAVIKDILHQWTYPMVPDILFSRNDPPIRLDCQGIYKSSDIYDVSCA